MTAATPGQAGGCGCPGTDGKVYHQRETCTDPVVAKLDWYADAGRIGAAPEPVSAGRAPGQAVREALLTWEAQPASWRPAEPWDQLPSWLRKKWESIAQAAIDAATDGTLRACGYNLADIGRFLEAEVAAQEPHAADHATATPGQAAYEAAPDPQGRPTTSLEDAMLANIDGLNGLVRDILQSLPDTADEQQWRDRAGALNVCDPDGMPYAAYTEADL